LKVGDEARSRRFAARHQCRSRQTEKAAILGVNDVAIMIEFRSIDASELPEAERLRRAGRAAPIELYRDRSMLRKP
jgi:hypothetical protein